MLSLFPDFLTYGLIAPTLLRLTVAVIGLMTSWSLYRKGGVLHRITALVYTIFSLFLSIGLYTQLVSLLTICLIRYNYWMEKKTTQPTSESMVLHIVLIVILISLLFTGPGFLAIDKPL